MLKQIANGLVLGILPGCVHHQVEPLDFLPFAFEARVSGGEVWVLPTVALHPPIKADSQTLLGAALAPNQRVVRAKRTSELAALPDAIAEALPGEVNARLGERWRGQFRHHGARIANVHRIADAVGHRRPDLHAVLETFAANYDEWVLLTWVTELSGDPLILRALPGEVVRTTSGPVVVDFDDDPHLVRATLGMALLSPEGQVVLRYEDGFSAVLTGTSAKQQAARQLAQGLADEVALVWMTERRLAGSR